MIVVDKKFVDWFELKPKIDLIDSKPPLVKERDLWWCHLGENIGTEINGKGSKFNRPAIIYKKLSKYTFLVIPTSTQIKQGSWFTLFNYKSIEMIACLHQIKIIDHRRLHNHIGTLSKHDFGNIQQQFSNLYTK